MTNATASTAAFAGRLVAVLLFALVLTRAQSNPAESGRALTVPPGFQVERVAGPPLVNRPIVAAFDDEGRLYVADSSGSNDRVEKQLADRPHRIVRLEDTNDDGRFDTSVVFADRMMLPEGTMWLDGSLYVAAPPSIWKLTDTDGDGVADRRDEWFQGRTLTGCANDLHGPYLGPDGWIYWTKGAFAEQTYEKFGETPLVTRAAHVFRRRPGDATIDVVMTGGMDNPVDVAFTTSGERIVTATFVEHPQAGRRDGLVHAIYGGVYGKPHAVLDGHKRTGDLMPIMCQLGPAVPAGLTRYASDTFGEEYRDNFFAAMFNLRKVTRHALVPSGATFTTRDVDFLASTDRDFHPTDVVEDADGSLLVIDTGPWYKLCCPTSQLAKPDVLGAIYRVRRTGAAGPTDPRGRRLAWQTMTPAVLVALLDDPRPAVRDRALGQFARIGASAVLALADVVRRQPSVDVRRNAVWALTRIAGPEARAAVRSALSDRDDSVRQAAVHSAGLWRDGDARPGLVAALTPGRPSVQRAAAEALGRLGDPRAVAALLTASAAPIDRVLEHSLTYALIEIGDAGSVATGLTANASGSKRAALVALDQMGGGRLTPGMVVPLLDASDPVMQATAWWIALGHAEWGGELAGYFRTRLSGPIAGELEREDLQQKIARFAGHAAVQQLLADVAVTGAVDARLTALRSMATAGSSSMPAAQRLKVLPSAWADAVSRVLPGTDRLVAREAVAVVRALPAESSTTNIDSALLNVARDPVHPPEVRLNALAARRAAESLDAPLFEFVTAHLGPASPGALRSVAAGVLERARLDRSQLLSLAAAIETAGPLEIGRLLAAFGETADEEVGLALVRGLERSKARAAVRSDVVRAAVSKYPASVKSSSEAWLASGNGDAAGQLARLESLVAGVGGGDMRRGQAVFNSEKAACLSCHAIGYIGGRIGPDLTRIGQVRGDRDLVEAIVFPSASFARSYEPVVIQTRTGAVHSGMLRSDAPDEILLTTITGTETRIPKSNVATMEPAAVSPMPQGYGELLTRQELADLIAFLRAAQ